jgi:hypothetical protein
MRRQAGQKSLASRADQTGPESKYLFTFKKMG